MIGKEKRVPSRHSLERRMPKAAIAPRLKISGIWPSAWPSRRPRAGAGSTAER